MKTLKRNMTYKIYSIVYDEKHKVEYTKYDNSHINTIEQKSYIFEYNPMIDILTNHTIEEDYLGIFSWKFLFKTAVFKNKLFWLLDNNQGFDCYSFCNFKFKQGYLNFTEAYHPGFKNIFLPLCEELGLQVSEPQIPIYSNFFVLRTELYKDYVETVIKPAIELLETKFKDLAWKDAKYISGLKKDELKKYTGLDHYTYHTFVLERLINQYITNKNLTLKKLV